MTSAAGENPLTYVQQRIAQTMDAITNQMALVLLLDRKGHDPSFAKDRLNRLQKELDEWQLTLRALSPRSG